MSVVIAIHNVQPRPQSVDAHKMPAKEESAMDRVLPAHLFIQCLCLVYNIASSSRVLVSVSAYQETQIPNSDSKLRFHNGQSNTLKK